MNMGQLIGENPLILLIFWGIVGIIVLVGAWFLLKYIIYQIAHTIGKGLKDAKGE